MLHGDILGLAPPLVTTKDEIGEIIGVAKKAVRQVMDELVREKVSLT
jgi:L-2,4-diaminobutyrate transaminase